MVKKSRSIGGLFTKAFSRFGGILTPGGLGIWPRIREGNSGDWQRNIEFSPEDIASYAPVFACLTLIASDVAKLPLRAITEKLGVWVPYSAPELEKLLERPNPYQNRIQFVEDWILSKLSTGNAFILIERPADGKGVKALRVLDPNRVRPMVSNSGAVFYELGEDNLTGVMESTMVPASEMIHDRFNCLYHPLVGLSPIWACAVAAGQGLAIQRNSTRFFSNGSVATGILTAPGAISDEDAERLKKHWEDNYTGEKGTGKVAVLGDGVTFTRAALTSADAQLIEQLKWTVEIICMAFKVPPHMIGHGDPPAYGNVQAVYQQYYSQCLQVLLEAFEICLDQGLRLPAGEGVEFDINTLLRMDSKTQMEVLSIGTGAGILKLDEARRPLGYEPMAGGNSAYLQEQNFSVAALAKRDAKEDPWESRRGDRPTSPAPAPAPRKALSQDAADDVVSRLFGPLLKAKPEVAANMLAELGASLARKEPAPVEPVTATAEVTLTAKD